MDNFVEVRAPIPSQVSRLIDSEVSELDVMISGFMETLDVTYEDACMLAKDQLVVIQQQEQQRKFQEQIQRCKQEQQEREKKQQEQWKEINRAVEEERIHVEENFKKILFGIIRFFKTPHQRILRQVLETLHMVEISMDDFAEIKIVLDRLCYDRKIINQAFIDRLINLYMTTVQFIDSDSDDV